MNRFRRLLLTLRHAYAMWKALDAPKNRAKGDWQGMDHFELRRLLGREVEEFSVALWGWERGIGSVLRIEEEAADVSAYAAMIADVARRKEQGPCRPQR